MPILRKSVLSSAVIMFIIANAGLFAFLLTRAGVPDAIGQWLRVVLESPALFLLGVNAALFVIGMFHRDQRRHHRAGAHPGAGGPCTSASTRCTSAW